MGYQEHEELYLSLSRKELQGLCKRHGLSANKSKVHLAKSLESFFKSKNASSRPSEEVSLGKSTLPELKPEEPINLPEETSKDVRGECERRTDASETDSYGLIKCVKEKVGQDKGHLRTSNQVEISSHIAIQTPNKALDTSSNVVCAYPANNGTTEGFGCSVSYPGTAGIQPVLAPDPQEITALPRLGCEYHDSGSKNGSKHFPELKNFRHNTRNSAATSNEICNLPLVCFRNKTFGECSMESGIVSSNVLSTEVPPLFQFFVSSEEGINLCVDLSSSPLDWIKSLKDEVCIYQNAYQSKAHNLCHEIRGLGDVSKSSKASSTGNIETDFKRKGAEGNNMCTKSSLSSNVTEHCHSVPYSAGINDGTSRSTVLTSNIIPVEISGYLDEGNQVVSSSCITYSDVKNCMASDSLSCPRYTETLLQNSAGASSILNKTHTSVFNGSLKKIMGNLDVKLSANGTKERQTLNKDGVYYQNIEAGFVCNTSDSIYEKSCLPLSSEIQENVMPYDTGSLENHSGSCELSSASGSKEMKLSEVGGQHKDSSAANQFGGQQILDCPFNDVQLDVRESTANHLLDQQACGDLGNFVPEAIASTLNEDLGTGISVEEKENSECSQSSNLEAKTRKRFHSSEILEEFQSKRQHSNGENQNNTMMNLRSTKTLARESLCDPVVLPRRSVRLISK